MYGYDSSSETMRKETSAFIIKDECPRKFAPLLKFFIQLLVVASYFAYRYFTVIGKTNQ